MTELKPKQSRAISRRTFCRSAIAAAAAINIARPLVEASQTSNKVKFYKNFSGGHIGVRANQRQALEYAVKYGFDSITPSLGEFENKSAAEIRQWVATMKEKGVRYGSGGLPVEFRRDEDRFKRDLTALPKRAGVLKQMGVTRTATWITPGHRQLTYLQNFKQLERRFREVAKVLKDNDLRLGLEFVGPRTSRARSRFPFISTQLEMMELVEAIGRTVEELLQLSNNDIVHVHVNDAPSGIEIDKQTDNRRQLPITSGVINMKGFVNALVKIGYDGPVECEPFDQGLRKMEDGAALQKTIESLDRLWDLIAL
ncbi:MAG: sugar phosphate isomerase/epimerase family protein [Planctomycetota bacterium]